MADLMRFTQVESRDVFISAVSFESRISTSRADSRRYHPANNRAFVRLFVR